MNINRNLKIKNKIIKIKSTFNSLKFTVFLLLNTFIIISVLLVALICFKAFEKILIDEIGNNRVDVLRQIGERTKILKDSAKTLSNLYFYDNTLNVYLEQKPNDNLYIDSYLKEITEKYKTAFTEIGIDYYVDIIGDNGYNYYSYLDNTYEYIKPKEELWYKDLILKDGNIFWISSFKYKPKNENVFSAARILKSKEGNVLGILLVNINERLLYKTYENTLTEKNKIYIIDETGSIVSSRDEKMLGINFFHVGRLREIFKEKPYTIIDIAGRTVLFTNYYEKSTGWTILEEIPIEEVITPINSVRNIIIIVTITIVIVGFIASYKFSNNVANPIKEICNYIYSIEDESFQSECKVVGWTEISILNEGLNSMLFRIKNLLNGIMEKETQKRKLELRFLQAQINPHFMYNTLFSIKCMIEIEKYKEADNMIVAFIQLLRNTLSNPDEFITLKNEFDTLTQYALLQQIRYSNKFIIEFNLSESIYNYKIPKLLIQPLIENSIFHGLERKKENGIIYVSAKEKKNEILIIVEDNGIGIPEDIINEIEKGKKLNDENHIGIFNIKERINLNFGNNYGLNINRDTSVGTKITINLPTIN